MKLHHKKEIVENGNNLEKGNPDHKDSHYEVLANYNRSLNLTLAPLETLKIELSSRINFLITQIKGI